MFSTMWQKLVSHILGATYAGTALSEGRLRKVTGADFRSSGCEEAVFLGIEIARGSLKQGPA